MAALYLRKIGGKTIEKNKKLESNTNKLQNIVGIISLITSLLAIICCWIPNLSLFTIILGIFGVLFGIWSFINVITKKSSSAILSISGILLGLFAVALACNLNSSESKEFLGESSKEHESFASQEKELKKEYNIGEPIFFDENTKSKFAVVKVERNYFSKYSENKEESEYVRIKLYYESEAFNNISVSPYDFELLDSSENISTAAPPTFELEDAFQNAELKPGDVKVESIVFEVPKDDNNLKLIYEPSFLPNKKLVVKL